MMILAHEYFEIDRTSPVPAYYQIEMDLKKRIIRREWEINSRLPAEEELAKQYDVSRLTLRQALAELEKDGIIRKHRGKGTFINADPSPFVTELNYSLISSDDIPGQQSRHITAQVLEQRVVTDLFPSVAEHLRLTSTDRAIYIKRLFLYDKRPLAVGRIYISERYAPGLESKPLINNSISQSMRHYYNQEALFVEDHLEAVRATHSETTLLECKYDAPLILVTGVSYRDRDEPMEYSTTLWAGDFVRFRLHLRRGQNGFLIEP